MRELQAADLLQLAEICTTSEVSAFESGVLELLRRHVGFDLAMFRRKHDYGAVSVGFDPGLLRAVVPFWPAIVAEALQNPKISDQKPSVACDAQFYDRRQFESMVSYRVIGKPSGEKAGVSLLSWRGGHCIAHLRLARGQGEFKGAELDRLRAFMPQIQLAETLRYVQSKLPETAAALTSDVSDESEIGARRLSARERDIVSYLGLGYTNEQIASACGSSPHTIRNQLSRAYAKLGVASRAEAVSVLAYRARRKPAR
jgi:DNA-binding CsgD family transcriptional regulator